MLLVVLGGYLSSINKISDFLTDLCGLILLNDMTAVSDDMHLVLSLHMGDSQFGVHALSPRQKQHLLGLKAQEALRQPSEPLSPVFLCRQQVCAPHILL